MGGPIEKTLLILSIILPGGLSISSSWRPIVPAQLSTSILHQEAYGDDNTPLSSYNINDLPLIHQQIHSQQDNDQCALYKVAMNQQLYFEYIHYKIDFPDLTEFTLCMWTKFTNHTNDHPLFSYAVGDQPRGILSWVANTARSSYFMMNLDGHNLYRLNYPLRLNKWYHSCQSWNGRTGEWQVWVNDERVGRGFNNRLVGHVIKGGGIAISGQEQRQLGGGFLEGEEAPAGSGGMLGELTMLQLYEVALSAGKAHKDHKHHHAHHYEHDTSNNRPRTTTPAPLTGPPLPRNPFLTGGQINHRVKINPGADLQIVHNGVTLRHPSLPPPGPPPIGLPPINPDAFKLPAAPSTRSSSSSLAYRPLRFFDNDAPASNADGFTVVDGRYHNLFKREKNREKEEASPRLDETAMTRESMSFDSKREIAKRDTRGDIEVTSVKRDSEKKSKRGLVQLGDGLLIDDAFLVPQTLSSDDYYFNGLASLAGQTTKAAAGGSKSDEREPAEGEVKLVMDVCDGCANEPFEKALVIAWRGVPKKLYSGALYLPAVPSCKAF